jgi:uncharacterized protein (TIGR04255 family)
MNETVDKQGEKLPISVEPCPIVEALAEIRFEPSVSPDAVFGYAHRALQENFPKATDLPGRAIPEAMRISNPIWRF